MRAQMLALLIVVRPREGANIGGVDIVLLRDMLLLVIVGWCYVGGVDTGVGAVT